jgi:hypothetical protein
VIKISHASGPDWTRTRNLQKLNCSFPVSRSLTKWVTLQIIHKCEWFLRPVAHTRWKHSDSQDGKLSTGFWNRSAFYWLRSNLTCAPKSDSLFFRRFG